MPPTLLHAFILNIIQMLQRLSALKKKKGSQSTTLKIVTLTRGVPDFEMGGCVRRETHSAQRSSKVASIVFINLLKTSKEMKGVGEVVVTTPSQGFFPDTLKCSIFTRSGV